MASALHWLSSSSFNIHSKLKTLPLNSNNYSSNFFTFTSLSFSSNPSHNVFSKGSLAKSTIQRPIRHSVVCEAAPKKKADSAAKRARQAEKRRIYNKTRKSEIRTRMKKALDGLKKKPDAQPEEVLQLEKLIVEAFSVIDKAVKVGTLNRNTGRRRKSWLARRKKAVEIHHGWFAPAPAATA